MKATASATVKTASRRALAKDGQGVAKPLPAPRKRAPAKPPPEPVRPYHHGNLREELIRCGKSQLEAVGLADLSLRQIAAEVGVSQVAPKHHFGNKEGLLAAIAASGFRDLTEFRFSRIKPQMNSEQRMRVLLSSYVVFATQHPALFHLMFAPQFKTPQLHAELNESASQSYRLLSQASGEYLADLKAADGGAGMGVDEAARIAWMCMHGVATLLMERRINPLGATKTSREQLINRTLDVVFAGIRSLGATS